MAALAIVRRDLLYLVGVCLNRIGKFQTYINRYELEVYMTVLNIIITILTSKLRYVTYIVSAYHSLIYLITEFRFDIPPSIETQKLHFIDFSVF